MIQKSPMFFPLLLFRFLAVAMLSHFVFQGSAYAQAPPENVTVLPVFVVPKGEQRPTKADKNLLMKHVQWAQDRYREMLGNRSTFGFETEPVVFESKRSLKQFGKGHAANLVLEELFEFYQMDRFSCKYVFLAVFINPEKRYPGGGGRPINGGVNTGGGIVVISTHAMKTSKSFFQTTLQHELGHSFGLVHVNMYGYDMKRNESIMSYNPSHRTNGLRPSKTPGGMIPEDIRTLALNDRVFEGLEFDEKRDSPAGYKVKQVRILGPMKLPEHPLVRVEILDSETKKGSIENIVHSSIKPSFDRGKIKFDEKSMWQSVRLEDGVASIRLTFPMPIELNKIMVYSQHSGKQHGVKGVRVSTIKKRNKATVVAESKIVSPDAEVKFNLVRSKQWKIEFQAGKSKTVALRGLRFFNGDQELFPPSVPYQAER